MKLYELTNEMNAVIDSGIEGQCLTDTLEAVQMEFSQKAKNLVQYTENIKSDISALDAEIKRLQARKKAKQASIKQLEDYLRHNMESSGIDKIECDLFTITLRKAGSESVVIEDESLIASEYKIIKETVNKTAVKTAIKAGADIKGAHLIEGKRGLLIK